MTTTFIDYKKGNRHHHYQQQHLVNMNRRKNLVSEIVPEMKTTTMPSSSSKVTSTPLMRTRQMLFPFLFPKTTTPLKTVMKTTSSPDEDPFTTMNSPSKQRSRIKTNPWLMSPPSSSPPSSSRKVSSEMRTTTTATINTMTTSLPSSVITGYPSNSIPNKFSSKGANINYLANKNSAINTPSSPPRTPPSPSPSSPPSHYYRRKERINRVPHLGIGMITRNDPVVNRTTRTSICSSSSSSSSSTPATSPSSSLSSFSSSSSGNQSMYSLGNNRLSRLSVGKDNNSSNKKKSLRLPNINYADMLILDSSDSQVKRDMNDSLGGATTFVVDKRRIKDDKTDHQRWTNVDNANNNTNFVKRRESAPLIKENSHFRISLTSGISSGSRSSSSESSSPDLRGGRNDQFPKSKLSFVTTTAKSRDIIASSSSSSVDDSDNKNRNFAEPCSVRPINGGVRADNRYLVRSLPSPTSSCSSSSYDDSLESSSLESPTTSSSQDQEMKSDIISDITSQGKETGDMMSLSSSTSSLVMMMLPPPPDGEVSRVILHDLLDNLISGRRDSNSKLNSSSPNGPYGNHELSQMENGDGKSYETTNAMMTERQIMRNSRDDVDNRNSSHDWVDNGNKNNNYNVLNKNNNISDRRDDKRLQETNDNRNSFLNIYVSCDNDRRNFSPNNNNLLHLINNGNHQTPTPNLSRGKHQGLLLRRPSGSLETVRANERWVSPATEQVFLDEEKMEEMRRLSFQSDSPTTPYSPVNDNGNIQTNQKDNMAVEQSDDLERQKRRRLAKRERNLRARGVIEDGGENENTAFLFTQILGQIEGLLV